MNCTSKNFTQDRQKKKTVKFSIIDFQCNKGHYTTIRFHKSCTSMYYPKITNTCKNFTYTHRDNRVATAFTVLWKLMSIPLVHQIKLLRPYLVRLSSSSQFAVQLKAFTVTYGNTSDRVPPLMWRSHIIHTWTWTTFKANHPFMN